MAGRDRSDSEFTRPFAVESLGEEELVREIEAGPAECRAVARRLGLEDLSGLRARFRLARSGAGPLIRVSGRFEADVVQLCVVSLEPIGQHLAEDFVLTYSPEPVVTQDELELTLADEDLPEEVLDGVIDLGEAAVQQLAVALDPYPRRPDAEVPAALRPAQDGPESPFAALEKMKGGKQA
ncbi:MAG: DUF177 domain-containing protein [Kiloniellales bacterium]|nr:DUF177 domain-containing protein [Kiloniellales bacterium]